MRLSRDPAIYLSLFATVVRLASAFVFHVSDEQQAVVNAVATAVAGLIVAFWVLRDGQVPAILGVVQALLALAIGFGLNLSGELQATIMSFVGLALAAFVRTQVTAKVPAIEVSAHGVAP